MIMQRGGLPQTQTYHAATAWPHLPTTALAGSRWVPISLFRGAGRVRPSEAGPVQAQLSVHSVYAQGAFCSGWYVLSLATTLPIDTETASREGWWGWGLPGGRLLGGERRPRLCAGGWWAGEVPGASSEPALAC